MGWESFDVVRFDLGPFLQGHTRIVKLKSAYNLPIIGPRGLHVKPPYRKSWAGNLLLQGQTRTAKLKRVYNAFIIDPRCLQCETNFQDIVGWESSDVSFDLWPHLQSQAMVHWLW